MDDPNRLQPSFDLPADGYRREFTAALDYLGDKLMRVRGTLRDHQLSITHTWTVEVPDYTIKTASAEHQAGDSALLDPALADRVALIAGSRTTQGFTRAVREALGGLPGHRAHQALAIDMARISLQGFPVPRGDHERFAADAAALPEGPSRIARMAWARDRADWAGICNACYAYSDEAESLFAERTVTCFDLDKVSPEPGQEAFFSRRKTLSITADAESDGYLCRNAMNDTFHDLDVTLGITRDGTVRTSASSYRRLAFMGICEDAQSRPPSMEGLRLDAGFARVVAEHVGGRSGCSHLFDLSVDCLRCFDWAA